MSWRPDNWDETIVDVPSSSKPIRIGSLDAECGGMFEAGADAMLEALLDLFRKLGYGRAVDDFSLYVGGLEELK